MASLASSLPASNPMPSSIDLEAKEAEINLILSEPEVDLWRLRELALTEGGLVNDTLRKRAWPKLVGLHGDTEPEEKSRPPVTRSSRKKDDNGSKNADVVLQSEDAEQIDRDVSRCTWHLLTGSQRSRRLQMENKHRKRVSGLLKKKQVRLANLINLTLVEGNDSVKLRYYQGYHDVACIFLHALGGGGSGPQKEPTSPDAARGVAASMGLDLPMRVLLQVSHSHFRDAMQSNFRQLQLALRLILFPLIATLDPQVHDHLYDCDMEPFFALSWIITWFSHDVRDTDLVKRLFDAFLVSHPLFVIYLSVAMVLHPVNRLEILQTDCDFASVHQALAGLPKNSCMTGWRYQPHQGYVSGDEDDRTISTDMDAASITSADAFMEGQFLGQDPTCETSSLISSNLSHLGDNERVPFQELIDMALSYMRRVPPRKLMTMAGRYYSGEPGMLPLIDQSGTIFLLQAPPAWALAAAAPADWVLKQRARESRGLKATNRRDRRKRSKQVGSQEQNEEDEKRDKLLEEKKKTIAVIASGVGRADDEDEERKKKKRKLMLYSGVALGLVALSCVVIIQYRPTPGPPIESDTQATSRNILDTTRRKNESKLPAASENASRMPRRTIQRMEAMQRMEAKRHVESVSAPKTKSESEARRARSEASAQTPRSSVMERVIEPSAAPVPMPPLVATPRPAAESSERPLKKPKIKIHAMLKDMKGLVPEKVLHRLSEERAKLIPVVRTTKGLLRNTNRALKKVHVEKLPGMAKDLLQNAHRALKESKKIKTLPGAHALQSLVRDLRAIVHERDLGRLPGIHSVKGLFRDVLVALKEKDFDKLPGHRAMRSLAEETRKALVENDAELVIL